MPSAASPRVTRRALLGGIALGGSALGANGLLAGCSSPPPLPFIAPDPDDEVRRAVAESELALIAAYDAVIAAGGPGAARLQVFRDQHAAHLTAVAAGIDLPTTSASPATVRGGVRALRRLEATATRDRIDASVRAEDGDLAELLGRIAASESGHVAALGRSR